MKVSIVIPAFNQAAFLADAIDSALSQTYPHLEVIVVDDGSTDETPSVCASFGTRIVYERQGNAGPSAARNRGVQLSGGSAVLFLDSDDVLMCDAVEQACARLARSGKRWQRQAAIVYCDYELFDDDGKYRKWVGVRSVSIAKLLRDNLLIPSGTLVTRRCLAEVGDFDGSVNVCEDWDYWLRAAIRGCEFLRVPRIGFRHREHRQSASKREARALQARAHFLQKWRLEPMFTARQHAIIQREIIRTVFRQRRVEYFDRGSGAGSLMERLGGLELDVLDPVLFAYGCVYSSPYFRSQCEPGTLKRAIDDFAAELRALYPSEGPAGTRAQRRVDGCSEVAHAANEWAAGRFWHAGSRILRGFRRDPSLMADVLSRLPTYIEELVRI